MEYFGELTASMVTLDNLAWKLGNHGLLVVVRLHDFNGNSLVKRALLLATGWR